MERFSILHKYDIDLSDPNFKRPGMRTMRKMRKEMNQLGDETRKQLGEHLTDDQLSTWEALEKERRDRMRERMQNSK